MKRLAPVAAVVMLAGGFVALRPFLFRETLVLAVVGGPQGPGPYERQAWIGIDLALQERNFRAGRFKVRAVQVDGGLLASHVESGTVEDFRAGPERQEVRIAAIVDLGQNRWSTDSLAGGFLVLSTEPDYPRPAPGGSPPLRVVPSFDGMAGAAARWALGLGARRVFLLEEMFDERSSAVADAFRRSRAVALAGELRFHEPYDSLADEVLQANPDAVFMAGEPRPHAKTREIFAGLRKRGFQGELLFADADPGDSLVLLAPIPFPEGCRLVSFLAPPPPEFSARVGYAPLGAWYGYLAAKTSLDAMEKADSKDPQATRRTFAPPPVPTAVGGYTFKNGEWMFTETLK